MDQIYIWVQNITCYLIFATVITSILPGKKYEKYIRLFVGMVLILLVLQPLTGSLRLDDRIAYYFESITFQNGARDLSGKFLGAEKDRLDLMMGQYESAVAADIENMVSEMGLEALEIRIDIGRDQEKESFGKVTSVWMRIGRKRLSEEGEMVGNEGEIHISPVAPVDISSSLASEKSQKERGMEDDTVRTLRKKITAYYDLEAEYVEIILE